MNNEKYVGMDVHKATCVIVVKDALGKDLMRTIISTDAQVLRDFFHGLSGTVHLAFEEGTQSTWLAALLKPLVKTLLVCALGQNKRAGHKTDFSAADDLAERLRLHALKPVYKGLSLHSFLHHS